MLFAGETGVDVVGEAIPNWIMAVTGALTLAAAVAAALFARSAAKHAGNQVSEAVKQTAEAHRQVELAEKQDLFAQQSLNAQAIEASRQHAAATRVERRALEARLDERMPFVIARAGPAAYSLYFRTSENGEWSAVTEDKRYDFWILPTFMQVVRVRFENVSTMPARINVVHFSGGSFPELPAGEPVAIAPGGVVEFEWNRIITANALAADDFNPDSVDWLFDVRFWVQDLALLVRDEYSFSARLSHFFRAGAQIDVMPNIRFRNIAILKPDRQYKRLADEGVEATSPAPSE